MKDVEFMLASEIGRNSRTSDGELATKAGASQPTVTEIRSLNVSMAEDLEEERKQ